MKLGDPAMVKPKFHYADFPVTSVTSLLQTRGRLR